MKIGNQEKDSSLPFYTSLELMSVLASCGSRGANKLQKEPYYHNLNIVKIKKKKKVKPGCFDCLYSQVGCKRCYRNRYESAEPLAQEKRFSRETSAVLTRTRWASPLAAVCMLFIKQQQRQTLHLPSPHELCICFHVVADPTRSNLNEPSSLLFFFFPTQMPPCLHTSLVHSQ